eukprot:c55307_g1_i1 orf=1-189(-)
MSGYHIMLSYFCSLHSSTFKIRTLWSSTHPHFHPRRFVFCSLLIGNNHVRYQNAALVQDSGDC